MGGVKLWGAGGGGCTWFNAKGGEKGGGVTVSRDLGGDTGKNVAGGG